MSYICPKCKKGYSQQEFYYQKFCPDCESFLIAASSKVRQEHWLFQANPIKFRIFDWWEDHPDAKGMTWAVRQYQKNIRKGDKIVIWVAGPEGGIFATAEANSNPSKLALWDPGEKEYWSDKMETLKINPRIRVKYIHKLFRKPISRNQCRNDPILSEFKILQQSQGTNFPITVTQWNRVNEIIRLGEK